jgi:hypothetical protein
MPGHQAKVIGLYLVGVIGTDNQPGIGRRDVSIRRKRSNKLGQVFFLYGFIFFAERKTCTHNFLYFYEEISGFYLIISTSINNHA